MTRYILTLLVAAPTLCAVLAAEPVTLELQGQVKAQRTVVTIGSVARLSGGDAALREQIARLDLADVKQRDQNLTISRKVIEYRLRLAGIDPASVQYAGADQAVVTPDRRAVTADEVVAAARIELYRWLTVPRETVSVELARPVMVRLPEIPAGEVVIITAVPHAKTVAFGRAQMDVVISTAEERLLAIGVDFEVKPATIPPPSFTPPASTQVTPTADVVPASAVMPNSSTAVLVHTRQRVTMLVRSGSLNVSAVGEAQQEGRMGDSIRVQNVDSKKVVNARVSGSGTVTIDLEAGKQ